MIKPFENAYARLVMDVLCNGEKRKTRNQYTRSLFGKQLVIDCKLGEIPLLQGRKMYYKGVHGELAAMLRKPKKVADFQKWGCNYWNKWGDENGNLVIDYGNAWHANGQIERLKHSLEHNPADRRMIIDGWRPSMLDSLSLPCCHYAYQFYVRGLDTGEYYLDMMWHQRSVDLMVGLPSDIIFAHAWLCAIANQFGFVPGRITMTLGDTHIYEGHLPGVHQYVQQVQAMDDPFDLEPEQIWKAKHGTDFCDFEPSWIEVINYNPAPKVEFELYE